MRRWTLPAALAAAVAGVLAGTGLHVASGGSLRPGEGTASTPSPPVLVTTPTTSAPPSTKKPAKTTKKTTKKATTTKRTATTASTTTSAAAQAPAFTELALLQPKNFTEHGWGKAEVTSLTDSAPETSPVRCTSIPPFAEGLEAAYSATYQGSQSTAGQVVARFETEAQAAGMAQRAVREIISCPGVGESHPVRGANEGAWWTLAVDDVRAVVAVARVQDRIYIFSMSSATSDPVETSDVDVILQLAARRLV